MNAIRTALQGNKTYITAAVLILTAVLSWINGDANAFQAVEAVLGGLGLGFLRAGVKTDTGAS
jgi:hypothetical protein